MLQGVFVVGEMRMMMVGVVKVKVVVGEDPVQLVLGGTGRIGFLGRICWGGGCRGLWCRGRVGRLMR